MVESLTTISYWVEYCTILEVLYLSKQSIARDQLQAALIRFYALILENLCRARSFFDYGTLKRTFECILKTPEALKEHLDKIGATDGSLNEYAQLVDTEAREEYA